MPAKTWNVTPTGAGATWTWAEANAKARFGDTLDMHGLFRGEHKTGRDGLTFDFTDAKIDADGADHALLLIGANHARVRGGEFFDADGAGIASRHSNHLALNGPEVHDNTGNGVSFMLGDYFDFRRLHVYRNATEGSASGISIYHPLAEDDRDVYHGRILNSDIHDNGSKHERQTDAFGVIVDDGNGTQPQGGKGKTGDQPYFGHRILIEGNDVHGNGGPGIGAVWSDHVEVVDNDLWGNAVQAVFGRIPVEVEFRQSRHGVAIGNDLGDGDLLLSGTKASPVEVSGYGNHYDELVLRGVVIGDHDDLGVEAAQMQWDM